MGIRTRTREGKKKGTFFLRGTRNLDWKQNEFQDNRKTCRSERRPLPEASAAWGMRKTAYIEQLRLCNRYRHNNQQKEIKGFTPQK
ncbi:hypothetical protein NPIL_411531 [Nephila pilipes]|uniref:Uncharacterized protein n=1 Tax=Nephila pilipes TaxID=299642 RepID=A0A8X6J9N6_NEPPI|nr:hypothetical protein NPIL_411531 [Nephila pilipes]